MRTCADISGCPPEDYINCGIFQRNTKCWLKGKGCLCTRIPELTCQNCEIYRGHSQEVIETIQKARSDEKEAFDIILKEYTSFIYTIAHKYYLPGGSPDDVFQEGLIGLHEAVTKFDPTLSYSFEKYASFCIRNSILASLKKATQKRQKALNESTSIHEDSGDDGTSKILVDENFESSLVLRMVLETFLNASIGSISAAEYKVLVAKIAGYSTEEIISLFNLSRKQVENAVFRARNKLKEILTTTE
jgi:RNA polymerase sporulation-specific sigma factor